MHSTEQSLNTPNKYTHTGSVQMLMGQSHGLAAVDLAPMKGDGKRLGNLEVRQCTAPHSSALCRRLSS